FRSRYLNLTTGAGYFDIDGSIKSTIGFGPPIAPEPTEMQGKTNTIIHHANVYSYAYVNILKDVTFTIGSSYDAVTGDFPGKDIHQYNPKFGITWEPIAGTTLRAAAFETLKRTLITDQTLEPTQVAGFNQFFDDPNGTQAWLYGGAIDQKFTQDVF